MKYAVVRTGGKQYRVSEGDIIEVERLTADPEKDYTFSDVLLYTADNESKIGAPLVEDVTVIGKILAHVKGEKIRVSHFKAKARYRKVTGHRQSLTKIQIAHILKAGEKPQQETKPSEKPAKEAVKVEAKKTTKAKKKE